MNKIDYTKIVTAEVIAARELAAWRESAEVSPMQGILALGEERWSVVLEYRDSTAGFGEKVVIDSSAVWKRNSQNIAFFAYLLGLTDEQVDDLFRQAMLIEA